MLYLMASGLVWGAESLLGFKVANLHRGGKTVGCAVTPRPPRSTTTVSGVIRRIHVRIHVGTQVGTHIGEPSDTSEPRPAKGKP
jgi:hypothetical protein